MVASARTLSLSLCRSLFRALSLFLSLSHTHVHARARTTSSNVFAAHQLNCKWQSHDVPQLLEDALCEQNAPQGSNLMSGTRRGGAEGRSWLIVSVRQWLRVKTPCWNRHGSNPASQMCPAECAQPNAASG